MKSKNIIGKIRIATQATKFHGFNLNKGTYFGEDNTSKWVVTGKPEFIFNVNNSISLTFFRLISNGWKEVTETNTTTVLQLLRYLKDNNPRGYYTRNMKSVKTAILKHTEGNNYESKPIPKGLEVKLQEYNTIHKKFMERVIISSAYYEPITTMVITTTLST